MQAATKLQPSDDAVYQRVGDEAVLIQLAQNYYYSLNEVGAEFWELLNGVRTIKECAYEIATVHEVDEDMVLTDLIELAQELVAAELVIQN